MFARSLRAGHSFTGAIQMVAQEMPDPVGPEFQKVFDEQNLGIPLRQALLGMADRVDTLDVKFFVTAILIQRETGGNLAEIIDKISYVIRERFRVQGQLKIFTAQARMTRDGPRISSHRDRLRNPVDEPGISEAALERQHRENLDRPCRCPADRRRDRDQERSFGSRSDGGRRNRLVLIIAIAIAVFFATLLGELTLYLWVENRRESLGFRIKETVVPQGELARPIAERIEQRVSDGWKRFLRRFRRPEDLASMVTLEERTGLQLLLNQAGYRSAYAHKVYWVRKVRRAALPRHIGLFLREGNRDAGPADPARGPCRG